MGLGVGVGARVRVRVSARLVGLEGVNEQGCEGTFPPDDAWLG